MNQFFIDSLIIIVSILIWIGIITFFDIRIPEFGACIALFIGYLALRVSVYYEIKNYD